MAKISKSLQLRPSLIDRLTLGTQRQSQPRLRECVRRDLEDLFNTRWRCSSWPPNLDELSVSLVNYGIPDFTGADLGDPDRQKEFGRILKRVVENYEIRLRNVKVINESSFKRDRTLRFRIEADLLAEPAPEPVVFNSELKPLTGKFEITGAGR